MRAGWWLLAVGLTCGGTQIVVSSQTASQVARMDPGLTQPVIVKAPRPNYTRAAKKAKIQGTVMMEAVILADGTSVK